MTATGDAPRAHSNAERALELAIIGAFFSPGSAASIASAFSTDARRLHAGDVTRIWAAAKRKGELPAIDRPVGGPKLRMVGKGS